MASSGKFCILIFALVLTLSHVTSKSIGEHEHPNFNTDLSLVDDDGSMDTALINYLFARQMIKRLQSSMDVTDLQRKRSYWKQCAFNAVSCFGKK
uniref:Prohormone-1 n=1 Tax=Strigamia maritima TaxID=126957 RepID=T1IPL3_STRMM